MRRRDFFVTGLIIVLVGLMSRSVVLGGNPSLPEQAHVATHVTRMEPGWAPRFQAEPEVPATKIEPVPTRSCFVASWPRVVNAAGYRLDVSTSASFDTCVSGYCDLDVSNVNGYAVTGLNRGTAYYYRARAYDRGARIIGHSNVESVRTVATTGLIIHPTFDSSITTNPSAAVIEAMINRSISTYEALFSDPITVQILFRYASTMPDGTPFPSGVIATSFAGNYYLLWNTFITALRADARTSNDNQANASLPASALSTYMTINSANGRAVMLNTPTRMFSNGRIGSGGPYDGIVTLKSGIPFQFTRPTSTYDLDAQRVTEHEMDEVLGFGSRLGTSSSYLHPQDLFSWSYAGVRNITSNGSRFFSINSGSTDVVEFNQDSSGDFGDWAGSYCPHTHPYVQDAFVCSGQSSDVTIFSPEGINLDVIGYDSKNVMATTNATLLTSSTATLNGAVNPSGLPMYAAFQYGTTTNYGANTPTQTYSGDTTQSVSANITGLASNTTYHFRIAGGNSVGQVYGNDSTFTTPNPTGAPAVAPVSATWLTAVSARLNASIYPHQLTTTVYFQYGTTTSYGLITASQTITGSAYLGASMDISGLAASTLYHYRAVAMNSAGTAYGPDCTFATLSATGPPLVTTNPATFVTVSSATLSGYVDPHGLTTTVDFEYGTTTSYGSTTTAQSRAGNTYQLVSATAPGLSSATTYHFRTRAVNGSGTRYGTDGTFVTLLGDKSVTWQNDPAHDGADTASPLVTPLTLRWTRDLSASSGATLISYPSIAQGLVYITINTTSDVNYLIALNENTGSTVWWAATGGNGGFVNAAYDSGKIFVVTDNGLMKGFNAATGALLWSVRLLGQSFFTSPPTAANGIVFTGGAGGGGTVFAVNESNGAVLWAASVENGDNSSPAVVGGSVFVSYACPQAYAFNTITGQQLWHYNGPCEGGGGETPVVHAGQVYVGEVFGQTNGLVLSATNGALVRGFNSDRLPAFVGNLALFFQNGALFGTDAQTGQVLWSFSGDGGLASTPLVANQTIFIGSSSGTLYGLNLNGQQTWSTQVGAPIPAPSAFNMATGLGAGDGLLVVPAGSILAAYGN